jgi:predicted tellurium resistance membrane protein TerC
MNASISTSPSVVREHVDQLLVIRASAVIGLAGIALVHVIDTPDKFSELPYVGVMFLGLIAASLGVAALLIRKDDPRAWVLAALLSAGTMLAFVLSRVIGLPGDEGSDIGNWSEPLGLVSLLIEGCVLLLVVARFSKRS